MLPDGQRLLLCRQGRTQTSQNDGILGKLLEVTVGEALQAFMAEGKALKAGTDSGLVEDHRPPLWPDLLRYQRLHQVDLLSGELSRQQMPQSLYGLMLTKMLPLILICCVEVTPD